MRVPSSSSVLYRSRFLSTGSEVIPTVRCAIVGSGPAGFYTAKYLLEKNSNITVDMIERLPTPYGLVRQGVAPDHQEVKSVMATFIEVAENSRFRFFGNITLRGNDEDSGKVEHTNELTISELQKAYDVIVLAYGASSDRSLNIPGEELNGCISARSFVNWYNGHPYYTKIGELFDLKKIKRVVVIGQGNVAIDCARILMKSVDELEKTDISVSALDALRKSSVEEVVIVGRRGHIQASFTIKEIRELTKLDNVTVKILQSELDLSLTEASERELAKNRSKHRIIELIKKIAQDSTVGKTEVNSEKNIDFRFLLSPLEIRKASKEEKKDGIVGEGIIENNVGSIVFEKNILVGEENNQKAVPTGEKEIMNCELILKSVGYQSENISGIPFDFKKYVVPNKNGRVLNTLESKVGSNESKDSTSAHSAGHDNDRNNDKNGGDNSNYMKGLYVTGWLKRGPSGIVGTNINDAKETVDCILQDLSTEIESSDIVVGSDNYGKIDPIETLPVLTARTVITWKDYLRIEKEEEKRGQEVFPPKPREKICDIDELLSVAKNENQTLHT